MTPEAVVRIFEIFQKACPAPKTELLYDSPFTLLVAVMLSAQSTDKQVNIVTRPLFALANTPQSMLALGEERLTSLLKSLNLFRSKAKHLFQTCRLLCERHQGEVPDEREALEALPGVGRKTANVVLNTAFGHATIAVDTHIFRVAQRTGLAAGKTPRAVEDILLKVIPEAYRQNAHHWMILHGRYTCKARSPLCHTCLICDDCAFFQGQSPLAKPQAPKP
jgi:endonuclease-3